MWETADSLGRTVVLTEERWAHILEVHAELEMTREEILEVVATPERRMPGRDVGQEWLYATGFGPSRWVRVVVHYEQGYGRVVTAFPRRAFP